MHNWFRHAYLLLSIEAIAARGFRFSHWIDPTDQKVFITTPKIHNDSSLTMNLQPVFIPDEPSALIIPESPEPVVPDYRLYPNPTSGILYIAGKAQTKVSPQVRVEVLEMTGRSALPPVWLNGPQARLQLHGLKQGMYVVRIFSGDTLVQTEKLILVY